MLKKFQKSLRANESNAEQLLWHKFKNRGFHNYKFRRQHIIQEYIVDFVCLEAKLIIELDGGQHAMQTSYDNRRTLKLENEGFRVIRFWNHEVLLETEVVLETIFQELQNTPHPPRYARRPLPQGER